MSITGLGSESQKVGEQAQGQEPQKGQGPDALASGATPGSQVQPNQPQSGQPQKTPEQLEMEKKEAARKEAARKDMEKKEVERKAREQQARDDAAKRQAAAKPAPAQVIFSVGDGAVMLEDCPLKLPNQKMTRLRKGDVIRDPGTLSLCIDQKVPMRKATEEEKKHVRV